MSTYNLKEIVGIRCSSKRLSMALNYEPHEDLVGMVVTIQPQLDERTKFTFYIYTVDLGATAGRGRKKFVDLHITDMHKLPDRYRNASYEFNEMVIYKNSRHSRWFFLECEFKDFVDNKPPGLYGLKQNLNKIHDDMVTSLLYSVPTFYMTKDEFKLPTKEEINAMFGVPKFEYKKIIFNGPCTIILWKDGTKTIAKCADQLYDPEKGVAICFMKRALGETEGKKVLRKASKQYEDYLTENGMYPTLDPKDLHALEPTEYRLYFDNHIAHVSDINPNSVIRIDQSTIDEVKKVEDEDPYDDIAD